MSKGVSYLRDRYQEIRNYAYNNQMNKVNYKDLVKFKEEAIKQMERMDKSNTFDNYQQVDFYKDRFTQLDNAMLAASKNKNKSDMKDFTNQARQILKEKGFLNRNSYLSQKPADPKTSNEPPVKSKILQSFFQDKRSKIIPEIGFKSLLQNPPISQKSFKKKIGVNNDEITRLRTENQLLKSKLQNEKFISHDRNSQIQANQEQQRIRYLQDQNQRLLRDNTKLRSERSVTIYSNSSQPSYDDYLYSPYTIVTRQNDLQKITMRTSSDSGSYIHQNFYSDYTNHQINSQQNEVFRGTPSFSYKHTNSFIAQNKNYETRSQINEYERNKDRFSVFDMEISRSSLSDSASFSLNHILSNVRLGIQDSKTSNRNKAAFFKNSGLLVRDNDIQIAFKRTQTSSLSSNKVILYFNNKLNQTRNLNVAYQFQSAYYTLNVTQKVRQVGPLRQIRQVIEIKLRNGNDINSIIQTNVSVDGKIYKLWLPTMFIRFEQPKQMKMNSNDTTTKIIYPSKIFANEKETQKIIQKMVIYNRGQTWLWGASPVHEGPIKFNWKQGNKLEVTTSIKWIDLITFIMHDYS